MADNKKLAGMKQLLVRAWRERWTDTQWSIHSKAIVTDPNSDCALLSGYCQIVDFAIEQRCSFAVIKSHSKIGAGCDVLIAMGNRELSRSES